MNVTNTTKWCELPPRKCNSNNPTIGWQVGAVPTAPLSIAQSNRCSLKLLKRSTSKLFLYSTKQIVDIKQGSTTAATMTTKTTMTTMTTKMTFAINPSSENDEKETDNVESNRKERKRASR